MGHYAPMPRGRWVLTSLDDNEKGLEDNLGYVVMSSAWGVGILHGGSSPYGSASAASPRSRTSA